MKICPKCGNHVIPFDDVVRQLAKDSPGRVTSVNYADIELLHDAGIDCWHLAGTLSFQRFIDEHGSPEEKQRLRDLNVGYR